MVTPKHPKMIISSSKTNGCWGNPPFWEPPPIMLQMPVWFEKPLPLTPFHPAASGLHSAATGHRAVEVVAAQRSPAVIVEGQNAGIRKQPPKALKPSEVEGNLGFFRFLKFLFPSKHGSLFHCELDV